MAKSYDTSAIERDTEEIGSFETEQLINAITKIADLLRKCWGVAGAGVISSNLARTKDGKTFVGFNPTVPGKRVYALFGFVAINGFSEQWLGSISTQKAIIAKAKGSASRKELRCAVTKERSFGSQSRHYR